MDGRIGCGIGWMMKRRRRVVGGDEEVVVVGSVVAEFAVVGEGKDSHNARKGVCFVIVGVVADLNSTEVGYKVGRIRSAW